ncbi:MAG: hypothetical protein HUU54_11085 [Ignavibacteriaceae bacterium]|nr:hypothetical protein [Ignavibacteriaceae bacterium]
MTAITQINNILESLFQNEALIQRSEVFNHFDFNNEYIDLLFPNRDNNYFKGLNIIFKEQYEVFYSGESAWIIHLKNFNILLKEIIIDEFPIGLYITSDFITKIIEYLEINYFRKPAESFYIGTDYFGSRDIIPFIRTVIEEIIAIDKSFRIEGDELSEDGQKIIGKKVRIIDAGRSDISDAIINFLIDSNEKTLSVRSLLNKLNASPTDYNDVKKPIKLTRLIKFVKENSKQLGIHTENNLFKLVNHPSVIGERITLNRLNYYELIENLREFKDYGRHYIGIWLKDPVVFGSEFLEYLNNLSLVYIFSATDIKHTLTISDMFTLHEGNDFMINLLTLALNQSVESKSDFYSQLKLSDKRLVTECINKHFNFGLYSVPETISEDLTSKLINNYFPLLNFSNNPAHPYFESLSKIREKQLGDVLYPF